MFGKDPSKKNPNNQTEERIESSSFTGRINDQESNQSCNQYQIKTVAYPPTIVKLLA